MQRTIFGTWWKLGAGLLASGLAAAGRLFLNYSEAKWVILHTGYWLIAAITGLWLFFFWKRLRTVNWSKEWWKAHRWGLVCVLGCACFMQIHERRGYKVLFDEFAIAGVARNMHFERQASYPVRAHYIDGRLAIMLSGVDKRPFFFAFLLSLVHDLTGYREANAFYLNGGLAAALLGLVYFLGYRIGEARLGCLGVLLLTSLPLLAQNAAGGGFELVNLVMIGVFLLAGMDYLQLPGEQGLNLFVLTSVLLAQSRYESILYVLAVPAVALCKWLRDRQISLTWISAVAPLALILPLLLNIILFDDPGRLQVKLGQSAFLMVNLPGNLAHAVYYLFSSSFDSTDSLLLSAVGLIALVFLVVLLGRNFVSNMSKGNDDVMLTCVFIIVAINTVIEFCYFWGHWDDPLVSRFSLPLQLMMTLGTLRVLREFLKSRRLPRSILIGAGAWILFLTAPADAHNGVPSADNYSPCEYAWFHEFLAKKSPATTLSISSSSLGPILQNYPAISIGEAKLDRWQLKACLEDRLYQEILVLQRFKLDPKTGKFIEHDPVLLGDGFVLQTLAERRFRPNYISRISLLIGVKGDVKPPTSFEKEKIPFKNDEAVIAHLIDELP